MPAPDQKAPAQKLNELEFQGLLSMLRRTDTVTRADVEALREDIAEIRRLLTGGQSSIIITGGPVKSFMRRLVQGLERGVGGYQPKKSAGTPNPPPRRT